jgi:hypothetical protein
VRIYRINGKVASQLHWETRLTHTTESKRYMRAARTIATHAKDEWVFRITERSAQLYRIDRDGAETWVASLAPARARQWLALRRVKAVAA